MFSGLTNQVSSWIGKKQEGDLVKPDEIISTDELQQTGTGAAIISDEVTFDDGNKKDPSPTNATGIGGATTTTTTTSTGGIGSSKLDMLGNIGGSVKSQMTSWLGSGIPGLRKTTTTEVNSGSGGGGGSGGGAGEGGTPTTDSGKIVSPQISNKGSPVDKEDDASSDTGGADSEGHASEGSVSPTEDKDPTQIGVVGTKVAAGAKSFGSFLYSAVNKAGAKVSEASAKIKKTVEESSLLGEFNKEQEAFIKEKAEKNATGAAAVPPWLGCPNQESLKQECLGLSTDRKNFMRAPPEGVDFTFDYETQFAVCEAILAEDPNLEKMRFELVPKMINEQNFWRNYMYRVSLICQANELSSMVQENRSTSIDSTGANEDTTSTTPLTMKSDGRPQNDTTSSSSPAVAAAGAGHWSNSPLRTNSRGGGDEEFVSDTFTARPEDYAEVREGIRRLGLGDKKNVQEEDWERELDAELQDYEMVTGSSQSQNINNSALDEDLLDDFPDLK